jgi:hypothetical protein
MDQCVRPPNTPSFSLCAMALMGRKKGMIAAAHFFNRLILLE